MASRTVPIGDVAIGDRVLVLPGDRVPVDGVVVAGKTSVDESSLTGEWLKKIRTEESTEEKSFENGTVSSLGPTLLSSR